MRVHALNAQGFITLPEPQSASFEQTPEFAFYHLHTYSLIPEKHVNRNVSFMKTRLLGELFCRKQQQQAGSDVNLIVKGKPPTYYLTRKMA